MHMVRYTLKECTTRQTGWQRKHWRMATADMAADLAVAEETAALAADKEAAPMAGSTAAAIEEGQAFLINLTISNN
jgi:hypothetical protein